MIANYPMGFDGPESSISERKISENTFVHAGQLILPGIDQSNTPSVKPDERIAEIFFFIEGLIEAEAMQIRANLLR